MKRTKTDPEREALLRLADAALGEHQKRVVRNYNKKHGVALPLVDFPFCEVIVDMCGHVVNEFFKTPGPLGDIDVKALAQSVIIPRAQMPGRLLVGIIVNHGEINTDEDHYKLVAAFAHTALGDTRGFVAFVEGDWFSGVRVTSMHDIKTFAPDEITTTAKTAFGLMFETWNGKAATCATER